MSLTLVTLAVAAVAANFWCIWWHWRRMRAYYAAHELLFTLCLQAWALRQHRELWPLYRRTLGQHWMEQA